MSIVPPYLLFFWRAKIFFMKKSGDRMDIIPSDALGVGHTGSTTPIGLSVDECR
jgi:hypothetical protein